MNLLSFILGVSSLIFVTACDSRLAIPNGGPMDSKTNTSTLSPLSPAANATEILSGKKAYDSNGNILTGTMSNQGAWDLRTAFPGSGYYTGSSNAPASSQVCSSATLLGNAGTAVCLSGSATDAAATANVLLGKEYWDSSGTKQTGTMSNRGAWDLRTAFPGSGYYTGSSNAPASSQVCSSANLLGNAGTAVCLSGSATDAAGTANVLLGKEYWDSTGTKQTGTGNFSWNAQTYSMAPRKDTATVNPGTGTTRNVANLSDEISNSTVFIDNHNLIPDPKFDTDGRYGNASGVAKRHYLETITGRPTTDCGSSGSLEQRISDCSTQNGNKAFYDGKNYGQSGEGDWKLVTRITVSGTSFEVWRDERTKLIWSDRMSSTYNWYRASGYASTDNSTSNTGGYDARPGSGTGCSGTACQPNPPVSVCVDASLITTLSGYQPFTTPSSEDKAKGNLTYSSTPSVIWRLPTVEDWELANINGVRKVLPNLDYAFWTASSSSLDTHYAWYFGADHGVIDGVYGPRYTNYSVRCVGR